ncbi:MAG: hypothetical protein JSV79_10605 [Armatimonadota bacterium]|nr:MAG: hypothetical protein JSV79_10605 [Armatimonadota bacterium]
MGELVTVEQAEGAVRLAAVALPPLGLAAGAVVGALRRRIARGLVAGLLCGLAGPAIWLLWRIYNGITGVCGLDSVRGLLINLALFVVVGLLIGFGIGLVWRRQAAGGTSTQRE